MQRYFVAERLQPDQSIDLSGEYYHHMVNVMRFRVGEQVILVDSDQSSYLAEIGAIIAKVIQLQILAKRPERPIELPVEVTIACGLSKNDKLDFIVQKATEVGMADFIPLALQRDVVRWEGDKATKRVERMQKIAQEAAEQAHRNRIPQIHPLISLKELLVRAEEFDYCLVAYEEEARKTSKGQFKTQLQALQAGQKVLIIFGSEGGLASSEITLLEQANFILCSLGPRILRAETAPIYALSAISYELEL